MTNVPLVARTALVGTHRRTVSLRHRQGLRLGLITSRVTLFGTTVLRGVGARASAKRRPRVSLGITVSTRPIENENEDRDDNDEYDDGDHRCSAYGCRSSAHVPRRSASHVNGVDFFRDNPNDNSLIARLIVGT
jgi:hypothetical protein